MGDALNLALRNELNPMGEKSPLNVHVNPGLSDVNGRTSLIHSTTNNLSMRFYYSIMVAIAMELQ